VCFYSYASTNSAGAPKSDFYAAAGRAFGAPAAPPAMPWKAVPVTGHVMGTLHVDGGAAWLNDGAAVFVESDTGGKSYQTVTDGTGFFGVVEVAPDRYRVRLERGGRELYRATPQDVAAGKVAGFDLYLKAADFATALPRIDRVAEGTAAAPGAIVTIMGAALGDTPDVARAVPLAVELAGSQVLVNGEAAPLYAVEPGRIVVQLPYTQPGEWVLVARRAGMESAPFRLGYAAASPAIRGVRRRDDGYLEIYATGLGAVSPPVAAGAAPASGEPYNRTTQAVTVRLGAIELQTLYAGLLPYVPGWYQVNVQAPPGATGPVVLMVGGQASAPFNLR
jgi:uncharacterized protein (TIGR03437 family)